VAAIYFNYGENAQKAFLLLILKRVLSLFVEMMLSLFVEMRRTRFLKIVEFRDKTKLLKAVSGSYSV
jgi:hypothetical protein